MKGNEMFFPSEKVKEDMMDFQREQDEHLKVDQMWANWTDYYKQLQTNFNEQNMESKIDLMEKEEKDLYHYTINENELKVENCN